MEEKLKQVIHLLQEIDDELDNEICLNCACLGDEIDEFTFWGLADMVIDYMQRRAKQND